MDVFENLDFWMANIKEVLIDILITISPFLSPFYFQHGSDNAVLCIIGNKCDADTRQVTIEEGIKV